ncbi:hypothetical protein Hanom_Chr04g00309351 [Helianthus anomalus]
MAVSLSSPILHLSLSLNTHFPLHTTNHPSSTTINNPPSPPFTITVTTHPTTIRTFHHHPPLYHHNLPPPQLPRKFPARSTTNISLYRLHLLNHQPLPLQFQSAATIGFLNL